MSKEHAYRNIKLCTKDCLCLFVCPTGATNNETGQIDFSKCIGCGACAAACPSRAITMLPNVMPAIQPKNKEVLAKIDELINKKINEIKILKYLLEKSNEEEQKLFKALIHSNTVILEDLFRESEYMIPQSNKSIELLNKLKSNPEIENTVIQLLEKFSN